jgi:hypothetical protein
VIKAIETRYKGYRFRSRLEAKWAIFFDSLGVAWEYEKEGFELPNREYYLPDFWLPDMQLWAEVKPKDLTDREMRKLVTLAEGTGHSCLLLVGMPENKPYEMYDLECGTTIAVLLTNRRGRFYYLPADDERFADTDQAVVAARSARFEHGESPE